MSGKPVGLQHSADNADGKGLKALGFQICAQSIFESGPIGIKQIRSSALIGESKKPECKNEDSR